MRSDAEKRDSGDYFRLLSDVNEPDPRWKGLVRFDERGGTRPLTIDDRHAVLAELSLSDAVPDEVTIQFDTARNLLLYSWHAYRFIPVAELQAYRTVEMALRVRFGLGPDARPGMSKLLRRAVRDGLLKDDGFRQHHRMCEERRYHDEFMRQLRPDAAPLELPADVRAYAKVIADTIPSLRNRLAHGGSTLNPGGVLTLEICRDLIDQLFPSKQ